jgi:hypothetical protein
MSLATHRVLAGSPAWEIIMGDRPKARGQRIGVGDKPLPLFKNDAARLIAEIEKIDAALARPAPFRSGE